MRQSIINGLLYDVFESNKLFTLHLAYGNYKAKWVDVYQTKGGRYFKMNGWWGCVGSQIIEPIALNEVVELAARTGDVELYSKLSGKKVEVA